MEFGLSDSVGSRFIQQPVHQKAQRVLILAGGSGSHERAAARCGDKVAGLLERGVHLGHRITVDSEETGEYAHWG
jgi:hypothetical protein